MRLFKKAEPEIVETSWQDCVDYLRNLHQTDYNKMLKVVQIYRDADQAVKKALKIKPQKWGEMILDSEDTELGNFLDDEPKSTKIEVQ